jgi:multimeric flavodoxin WrbA
MKKVLVLHGSAHRGGDTDTLADRLIDGLGPGVDVRHFHPIDMAIAHCRACRRCEGSTGCVIHDDMDEVYPALREADIVVLATPMFWGYMTSQLKTLFDRLEAVVNDGRSFCDKDFVLLIAYRHYYGSMVEWLRRITGFAGSRMHAITCQTYDPKAGRDVPIRETPERLDEAYALGRSLASARD